MKTKIILLLIFLPLVLVLIFMARGFISILQFSDEIKTDERIESVKLPSGEILENHTYYESGFQEGERYNKLFLKNPANGNSELVGDVNYEAGKETPSLFSKFPHPQEFIRANVKVLVIGSIVCERVNLKKEPFWSVASFDSAEGIPGAAEYLESFLKPGDRSQNEMPGEGPAWHLHYVFDNLDLENNVLTVKRIPWNKDIDFPEYRDYPDYLIYSAVGYNGRPGYGFPWKFDEARTRAKNGSQWEKSMPFKMALDYSIITYQAAAGFMPHEENRATALAHAGAKEIATTTLELSDKELRSAECKYAILTNTISDKLEAMYGFACVESNRFYIAWEPNNPAAWQTGSTLNLNEWSLVGEDGFEGNNFRSEYIRLRKIEP